MSHGNEDGRRSTNATGNGTRHMWKNLRRYRCNAAKSRRVVSETQIQCIFALAEIVAQGGDAMQGCSKGLLRARKLSTPQGSGR